MVEYGYKYPIIDLIIGNAIKNADTPVMDALTKGEYLTVDASGLAVGLPAGLMGNSEVGHFTIGTGRVVYQVTIHTTCTTFSIKNRFTGRM